MSTAMPTAGEVLGLLLGLAAAYLVGGIPFAYVVGRLLRGIDIREHGSGNVGATNAWRVLGPLPGVAVFVLDALKGAVAVYIGVLPAAWMLKVLSFGLPWWQIPWAVPYVPVLAGMAAILGHTYTPFLNFKGGKGIATGAGVLFVLTPWSILILLGVFAAVVAAGRMISLGSVVAAALFPVSVWFLYRGEPGVLAFSVVAAALVVWRHRGNIVRMARGEEPRVHWPARAGSDGTER